MVLLGCENIGYAIGERWIIRDVGFSLNEGDRLGIVGVNGAGKSTLLRIITGTAEPTCGQVHISKSRRIGMLAQDEMFESEKSAYDEMLKVYSSLIEDEKHLDALREQAERGDALSAAKYAEAHDKFVSDGGYEFRSRAYGILRSLGFSDEEMKLPSKALSGGQKTRLALGRVLYASPDLLILDEPTNHLDMETLEWLEDHLRNYKKTIIVVSHDRYFLDRVTNKTLEIENCRCRLWSGNYSAYLSKKALDNEIRQRHYENQQREIKRIEAMIDQQRRWGQEHNFITIASKEKQLEHMEKLDAPDKAPEAVKLRFEPRSESGNDVLILKKLSKSFGEKELFRNLDLLVRKRSHLLIVGGNGCGKSTLLKIITGRAPATDGLHYLGAGVSVGYYDQENQQLDPDKSVLDELWESYGDLTQTQVRSALALFRFTGDDVMKKVSVLSGGERARLTLAKLVRSGANLLVLDEPTNHLDIPTREALETALANYTGTIIAVSHDRYFISRLSDRILDFSHKTDSGSPRYFEGTYEEYRRDLLEKESESPVSPQIREEKVSDAKRQYLDNKKAASDERKRLTRIRNAKEESEKIEAELDEISEEEATSASADHIRLTELEERRASLEARLLELYEILEEE